MVRLIKGQIIIELLGAFGWAGILLPALLAGLVGARSGKVQQEQRILAIGLMKEAEEATRSVREADWENIATNEIYHPMVSPDCLNITGSAWKLCPGLETVGDFSRSITIGD